MKTSIDNMNGRCIRRPVVVDLEDVQFDMEGQYSRHGFSVRGPTRMEATYLPQVSRMHRGWVDHEDLHAHNGSEALARVQTI